MVVWLCPDERSLSCLLIILNSFLTLSWVRALYLICICVCGEDVYGGVSAATGVEPRVTDAHRSVVQQLERVQLWKGVWDC